jgi:hypothetical protein
MDLQDLLAPLAGEFDIEEALSSWRWLVPEKMRGVVVTSTGDLFMTDPAGAIHFLDTISGTRELVADSVAEWERELSTEPELVDRWFLPSFAARLRDAQPLSQGECYSATHPPILGGAYEVSNWPPTNWRVHFSHAGRMHEAIKDLPEGTVITKWDYTEL